MDPAEDRAAYREALARAEAAALAETEGETPAPEAAPEELIEAVDVSASEQPLTLPEEETPAETVADTVETPEAEESPELLRERIAQLEARISEKDTFIGRQSGEVGELRQAVDALSQRLEALPQQAQPTAPQTAPVPITQELIEADPARATMLAFEQRDEAGLERAFSVWKDPYNDKGDPAAAASWLADRKIEQANVQHAAEFAKLREEMTALQAPAAEQAARREWEQAFSLVKQDHPEFIQNAERILTEVAPQYPAFADVLSTGKAQQKADVLKALYQLDRAQRTDPASVQAELEEAAKAAAEEEAATRNAAAVVTGQPTAGQSNAPALTPEQEEVEQYKRRFGGGVSLERGWTGRTAS